MEFLVRQSNGLPADMPDEQRQAIRKAERARAMELRTEGILLRLWRVPGSNDSIGLYDAPDATELHAALTSLPTYPWLTMKVEPLATHPQEMAE
jgi:muconolactone D-isomerase